MITTYIRSSSYNGWDVCQQQYFMTYVLGYRSLSGKKAAMGTMAHKVMEVLAQAKKFQQDKPKNKNLIADDDALGKVKIHVDDFYTKEIIDRLAKDSFTYYANGPESHVTFTDADLRQVTKWSHAFVDWNDGQFDPRYRNVVDPEPHFDLPIEEDWAKYEFTINGEKISGNLAIKGTIDLVTEVGPDTIEVIDWKTGRRKNWATGEEKTMAKLKKDPQLLLYHYAISRLYPEYNQAIMSIFFVNDGGPYSLCFDEDDNEMFLEMLKGRFQEIVKNQKPKLLSQDHKHFMCNKLCGFCKNNWEGTEQTMCHYVQDYTQQHGMEKTVNDLKNPDFTIGYYEAPG